MATISHKSVLNEFTQKQHFAGGPVYASAMNNCLRFSACVTVDGKTFSSVGDFSKKKQAEESAAKEACARLGLICCETKTVDTDFSNMSNACERSNIDEDASIGALQLGSSPQNNATGQLQISESPVDDLKFDYKSLLQEHLSQRGLETPKFTCFQNTNGFFSSCCEIGGKKLVSKSDRKRKKQAEQDAAREGLIHMGIKDPDKVFMMKSVQQTREIIRAKRTLTGIANLEQPVMPSSASSWLHTRRKSVEVNDDSFTEDISFEDPGFLDFDTTQNSAPQTASKSNGFKPSYASNKDRVAKSKNSPLHFWKSLEPTINSTPINQLTDLSVGEIWREKQVFVIGNSNFSITMKCPGKTNEIFCIEQNRNVKLEPGANILGLICKYDRVGSTNLRLKAEKCRMINYPIRPLPVMLGCGIVFIHYDTESSEPLQILLKRYMTSTAFINVVKLLNQWCRRFSSYQPVPLDVKQVTENITRWKKEEVELLSNINENSLKVVFSGLFKFKNAWSKITKHGMKGELLGLQERCLVELRRRNESNESLINQESESWNLPKGNFKHRLLTTGVFMEPATECACRELNEETGITLRFTELENCPYVDIPYLEHENLNPHKGDFVRYFIYLHHASPNDSCFSNHDNTKNVNQIEEAHAVSSSISNEHSSETSSKNIEYSTQLPNEEDESLMENAKRGVKRGREDSSYSSEENKAKRVIIEDDEGTYHVQETDEGSPVAVNDSEVVRTTVHEECTWQSIEMARNNSTVFKRIYQTQKFQDFLEKLRREDTVHG